VGDSKKGSKGTLKKSWWVVRRPILGIKGKTRASSASVGNERNHTKRRREPGCTQKRGRLEGTSQESQKEGGAQGRQRVKNGGGGTIHDYNHVTPM